MELKEELEIRQRIESYGIELLEKKKVREKMGRPNATLFPMEDVNSLDFWNNEARIEALKERISELQWVLFGEKEQTENRSE